MNPTQPTQQPQTTDPNVPAGLDPTAFYLAKSIKKTESGGSKDPYKQSGKSGEYGAYQYTVPTWQGDSSKYLGQSIPLQQATPEQQNEVAYKKVKDLLDQNGGSQTAVASIWNSGQADPNKIGKGKNKYGVEYDVPGYVNSVKDNYMSYSSGQSNPNQENTPDQEQPEEGLGQKLAGRLGDAGTALTDAASGKINPLSGILQAVGAGAGAVNDTAMAGIEHIPVVGGLVKGAEGLLGQGVKAAANTGIGKSVVGGIQSFQQNHPELSGDIGAAGNILGAAGLVTGAGELKDIAGNAVGRALGKDALSGTIDAISPEIKNATKAGAKNAAKQGLEKSGITGTISRTEDPLMREAAPVVQEIAPKFDKLKTYTEKLDAVQEGIGTLANQLRTNLSSMEVQPILTAEDLGALSEGIQTQIAENPLLTGDAGVTAQRIFDQFTKFLPKGRDIQMTDVLDARQKLDSWIQGLKGGTVFDPAKENAISVALRSVRQGANNLMEAKAPSAGVKQLLRKQSLLYKVIENIAPKASKEVGSTGFSRLLLSHPKTVGLIKTAGKTALQGTGLLGAYKGYQALTGSQ